MCVMTDRHMVQLTTINQGDGACGAQDHLRVTLLDVRGGVLLRRSPTIGEVRALPPLVSAREATAATTWWLRCDGPLEQIIATLLIEGRGGEGSAWVEVAGDGFGWCPPDGRRRVDRVYREGPCGIRGCVERVERYGQPTLWRYTVIAGWETPTTTHAAEQTAEQPPAVGPVAAALAALAREPLALPLSA